MGEADLLIAFEKLEAVRWAHFLKPDGAAVINDLTLPPLSVTLGNDTYPGDADIRSMLGRFTPNVHIVPGTSAAEKLGNAKMVNTVLLGYASRFLDIDVDILMSTIEAALPEKLRRANLTAFGAGKNLSPLS
jgi:indolepyruvate ferredoxin oxidoreductase beta subunit